MKLWPTQFSFRLALFTGVALAAQLAWLESERRKADRMAVEWRQQLRQSEELAEASPVRTPENEKSMADELLQLRREVPVLHEELFPKPTGPVGESGMDGRIDAYFDVAALLVRLRAAATVANVIVKPDEHFGFGAYAKEAPPVAGMARVRQQCGIAETILGCLFSGHPRELLAVRRELVEPSPGAVGGRQGDYFVLQQSLSLRGEAGLETLAFQVDFTGETAALREFLLALAQAPELLVVRSIEVVPANGDRPERAGGKESTSGPVARQTLSRFTVTMEAIRPTDTFAARTP